MTDVTHVLTAPYLSIDWNSSVLVTVCSMSSRLYAYPESFPMSARGMGRGRNPHAQNGAQPLPTKMSGLLVPTAKYAVMFIVTST